MNRESIIESTFDYQCSPFSTDELNDQYNKNAYLITSVLTVLEISVTTEMLKRCVDQDWLGVLNQVPDITEDKAVAIMDATIFIHNLAVDIYEEAVCAVQEVKEFYADLCAKDSKKLNN